MKYTLDCDMLDQHVIVIREGKGSAVIGVPLVIFCKTLQVNTHNHPFRVCVHHRPVTRRLDRLAERDADIRAQIARKIVRPRIVGCDHFGIKNHRPGHIISGAVDLDISFVDYSAE